MCDCKDLCLTSRIINHTARGPICATVWTCVCDTYLLSVFRYVAMASLRAQSSSRAWGQCEVGGGYKRRERENDTSTFNVQQLVAWTEMWHYQNNRKIPFKCRGELISQGLIMSEYMWMYLQSSISAEGGHTLHKTTHLVCNRLNNFWQNTRHQILRDCEDLAQKCKVKHRPTEVVVKEAEVCAATAFGWFVPQHELWWCWPELPSGNFLHLREKHAQCLSKPNRYTDVFNRVQLHVWFNRRWLDNVQQSTFQHQLYCQASLCVWPLICKGHPGCLIHRGSVERSVVADRTVTYPALSHACEE